jgi:hypothetical protein
MKSATFGLAALLAVGFSSACFADDIVAAEQITGSKLGVQLKTPLHNARLTISGPDGFHASASSKSGEVAIDLSASGAMEDGEYSYQLTAATGEKAKVRTKLNNGRDRDAEPLKGVAMSGTFNVKAGKIIKPDPTVREDNRRK